ncbi:hypothetical protein D9M71_88330 [compost metagenome]
MDIYAIRKSNLIALIGKRKKGECAAKWEMAAAHLSQILSDKTEKNLGDDVARRIEGIEGLAHGWMDLVHGSEEPGSGEQASDSPSSAAALVMDMLATRAGKALSADARERLMQAASEPQETASREKSSNVIHGSFSKSTVVKGDTIVIAQYDVRAAMGAGQLPAEYKEFVRNLVVDKVYLEDLGLKYTAPTNLKIITGWGQSMLGTIADNSPLIVDVGVTEYVDEAVYVFTWLGHLFIKRVQLLDAEHFQLVSDNKLFEPQKARMDDMYFHAKVLGVWNFQKLS